MMLDVQSLIILVQKILKKAISVLDMSNGKNSFIAGLGMAGTIIMADCPQYVVQEMEK